MVEGIIVGNGKPLRTEWEEIANDGTVLQMPFSVGHADLVPDDCEELAPKRKSWNSRNFAKR